MIQPKRVLKKLPSNTTIAPLPLRSAEEEAARIESMRRYQYLRDSAKPGFKVDTGYRPNLTDHAVSQQQYNAVRGLPVIPRNQIVLEDTPLPANINPDTYSKRAKEVNRVGAMAKGGKINDNSVEVVKAGKGAQILGAVAPFANFIPVVGPLVSAGMAAGSAIWQASDDKKAQRKAEREAQEQADLATINESTINQNTVANRALVNNLRDLPVYSKGGGIGSTSKIKKYAEGASIQNTNESSSMGNLDAVGGDLIPISDNAEVVSGNTHKENKIDGSYGVTLSANGQPVANVEDKEVVVDNDLVFSDKLKKGNRTFADIALDVNTKIGELQSKLKEAKNNAEKFSIQRTIQGLEKANQNLFNEQEVVKNNTVGDKQETVEVTDGIVPKGAKGMRIDSDLKPIGNVPMRSGNIPITTSMKSINRPYTGTYEQDLKGLNRKNTTADTFTSIAPLLADNISNAILAGKTPGPVKPTIRKANIIDTSVNVNPQLAKISKAVQSSNDFTRGNTSNSAVARANMTATNIKGAELMGDVYAKKEETERGLRDRQAGYVTDAYNTNAALKDEYAMAVQDFGREKTDAFSKNINNAVSNYQAVKQSQLQDAKSEDELTLGAMDDPTGEKLRRLKRLGKSYSDKNRLMLLTEMQRRKGTNQ